MTNNNENLIKRGDIVYIDIQEDVNNPHKQAKIRPCVVVSNDKNNEHCSMINYVPLTTKMDKAKLPTHVLMKYTNLPKRSFALCEGVNQIDKRFIVKKIGTVSENDMVNIDIGIMRQLCQSNIVCFVINNISKLTSKLSVA